MARTSVAKYVSQVRQELSKVTWSTRKETFVTTIMVLIIVTIASLFFLLVDTVALKGVQLFLGLGS